MKNPFKTRKSPKFTGTATMSKEDWNYLMSLPKSKRRLRNPFKMSKKGCISFLLTLFVFSAILCLIVNDWAFAVVQLIGFLAFVLVCVLSIDKPRKQVRIYDSPVVDYRINQGKTTKQMSDSLKFGSGAIIGLIALLLFLAFCAIVGRAQETRKLTFNGGICSFDMRAGDIWKTNDSIFIFNGSEIVGFYLPEKKDIITIKDLIDYQNSLKKEIPIGYEFKWAFGANSFTSTEVYFNELSDNYSHDVDDVWYWVVDVREANNKEWKEINGTKYEKVDTIFEPNKEYESIGMFINWIKNK